MDPKILDDIAKQLAAAVPADLKRLQDDLQKNFRVILDSAFSRMSLVTRDEFDVLVDLPGFYLVKVDPLGRRLSHTLPIRILESRLGRQCNVLELGKVRFETI